MRQRLLIALLDEAQAYQQLQAAAAREAASRTGIELEVVFAENNAIVQVHQLFERIHAPEAERPAAIVMQSVSGEGLERVARNAVANDIGWIVLNRRVGYVDGLREVRTDLPIGTVTPDQMEVGRIQGRQARALAEPEGLILYVQGPVDTSSAQDRLAATREVLTGPYSWKIVNGDWSEGGGELAMGSWLRLRTIGGQRPAVLIAQNDPMAVGARRIALKVNPDWRGVPVLGCDGLPDLGQRLVRSGELAATVVIPATAGSAVDLVARWLRTSELPPATVVLPSCSFPEESQLRRRA